jgi:hypothetical protein
VLITTLFEHYTLVAIQLGEQLPAFNEAARSIPHMFSLVPLLAKMNPVHFHNIDLLL